MMCISRLRFRYLSKSCLLFEVAERRGNDGCKKEKRKEGKGDIYVLFSSERSKVGVRIELDWMEWVGMIDGKQA